MGAVPLALGLGRWLGTSSSNTVLAAVPALLVVLLLPPLAVVGAELGWSHRVKTHRLRTGAAVAGTLGVHLLMVVGAVAAGVSAHRYGDAVLLTLMEALVLPLVVARLTERIAESPEPAAGESGGSVQ
jgi:hypothetical protein